MPKPRVIHFCWDEPGPLGGQTTCGRDVIWIKDIPYTYTSWELQTRTTPVLITKGPDTTCKACLKLLRATAMEVTHA